MPKAGQCSICLHRRAGAINRALVAGEASLSKIAKSFRVHYQSLYRHRQRHLPAELVKRRDETVEDATQALVNELEGLVQKTGQVLTRALSKNNYDGDLALRAIARRERQLELKARLLGTLEDRDRGPTTVKVVYVDKQLNVAGGGSHLTLPPAREDREESNGTHT